MICFSWRREPPVATKNKAINMSHPVTRLAGLTLLLCATVGFAQESKVDAHVKQLEQGDVGQRLAAARALAGLGPQAKDAVPLLKEALKEKDENLRVEAAMALARIEPGSKEAFEVLLPLLQDDPKDRSRANLFRGLRLLNELGPLAEPAVSRLARLLDHPDNGVVATAVGVLAKIGPRAGPYHDCTACSTTSIRTIASRPRTPCGESRGEPSARWRCCANPCTTGSATACRTERRTRCGWQWPWARWPRREARSAGPD